LIFEVRESGSTSLADLAQLGRQISLTYARAVNEALAVSGLNASNLAAIADHGQTLYHDPPSTIQWLDPALIAADVGCAVISDFRRADCAAGGQGAPLVPFADYILFRHPTKNRVLLNIGGIANITWLKAGGKLEDVIAFDTGPGNCVIDQLMRRARMGEGIDRDGELSLRGTASFPVSFLAIRLWKDVFKKPPKSADVPEMIRAFDSAILQLSGPKDLSDRLATACQMSGLGLELAFHHLPARPDEVIAAGGGIKNPALVREIEESIKLRLIPAENFGVPSTAKEALAFALLGAATLDGVPSNVPSVTGAKRGVALGSITPKP
jgi:anhydro-N-acetylmuramic acid kinase